MDIARGTGIFNGVRKAGLAMRDGRVFEVSLDSWEAPIVFDVTSVRRDATGATVYEGSARAPTGSGNLITIRVDEDRPNARGVAGVVRRVVVTCSAQGAPPDGVLELIGRGANDAGPSPGESS